MSAPRDAMALALDGIRAVEASAGTGKTFTIATLYLRLILERGLAVDEIVVATFTRAAAAELSDRLRRRLVIADTVLADDAPATPRDGEDGDHGESRKVIAQALAAEVGLDELQRRARAARLAIDTAFIGTLHGFCHRALAEFGFETGQALAQPELIEDIHDLEVEIVRDFWRRGSADATSARLLADTWGSPETLARQACDPRWRGRKASLTEPDFQALRKDLERARQRIAAWDATATDAFEHELARCVKTPRTRNERIATLRDTLQWALSRTPEQAITAFDVKRTGTILPDAIEKLEPKGVRPDAQPFDDLATLCVAYAQLQQAEAYLKQLPGARLLRDARAFLDAELPKRLAERNLMGHDQAVDRLAGALSAGEQGKRAGERIRARWKAALVDEFQDTDPRQWQVVETLFGPTTLVLVGDPKQAIYGFRGGDIFAWLQARAQAKGEPLRLSESWRAGVGLCQALNALFSKSGAFIEAGIAHPDIHSARAVAQRALLRAGKPFPALELWWLDPAKLGPSRRSDVPSRARARPAIQQACVAWIANLLHDDSVQLCGKRGQLQPLKPAHIAVLVNSNVEAHAMQAALGRAGVPASCNLRASAYASDEAADLALLLDALAAPDDPRRARAARASLLIGDDATTIAAGLDDDAIQAGLLAGIAAWAHAVQHDGPLPWLHRLLATAAPRLLAAPAGERRVANYLQLAELLQDLHATSFAVADLAARFARTRVQAADDADAARLRLDTDANAVTVSTVHAAKGLEYDVVLVPYAVLAHDPSRKRNQQPPLRWYHDCDNVARVAVGPGANADVKLRADEEIRAENVRKLYVAITRASALCVLPWGPVNQMEHSAACHLLHVAGRDQALPIDAAGCDTALRDLCKRAGEHARIVRELPATAGPYRAANGAGAELHARNFTRVGLQRDWQVWSFSRLVRGHAASGAGDPAPGTGDGDDDAIVVDAAAARPKLSGARFGTAVHAALERADYTAWADATEIPARQRELIAGCLRAQGLPEAGMRLDFDEAVRQTGTCVGAALNAALPCRVRACELAPSARRAEMEFHLSLAPAATARLFVLLHHHGYQTLREGVGADTLHGILTGVIDLVFQHAGRFHVIDWKTNWCPPYDGAALDAEIAAHDYDLQWLIYTLALHRWLKQRIADYDYDRHIGDVYYLFVRGLGDGYGIHVDRPARELIEAMDALFDARGGTLA